MNNDIYVIGLLPEPIKNKIFQYQIELSEKFGLYGNNYPELHITFARLFYSDKKHIDTLIKSLEISLKGYKPVDIDILGASCFGSPYKSVNLHVKSTSQLQNLSCKIKEVAEASGLSCSMTFDQWHYHISLANPTFAQKEWSISEFEEACLLMKGQNPQMNFKVDHLQLWYPVKSNYVIHDFYIKE